MIKILADIAHDLCAQKNQSSIKIKENAFMRNILSELIKKNVYLNYVYHLVLFFINLQLYFFLPCSQPLMVV